MSSLRVKLVAVVAVVAVGAVGAVAVAHDRSSLAGFLSGYEEVPAVSTTGNGTFHAAINRAETEIKYELTYTKLEGDVLQAHIHFGQKSVNGGIVAFLCSNLPNPPEGRPACPPGPAKITGTIRAAQVTDGAKVQGITTGEFAELVRAMRSGVTYANVHSTTWPGGEIRTQIDKRK
jgi:hypothetical protein